MHPADKTMKKREQLCLRCHTCKAMRFDKVEKPYIYEKHIDGNVLTFKAIGICRKCGYVHGELMDYKEVTCK